MVNPYTYENDIAVLSDNITIGVLRHTHELYKLSEGRKALKKDNIKPDYGRVYYVYSAFSDRYYCRELRSEGEIFLLKDDILNKRVYITWSEQDKIDIKEAMGRVYKWYHKKEGTLNYYKQYIPLLEHTLLYEEYRNTKKESVNYYTQCNIYEQRLKKLLEL